jgi:hypothetical protein
LYFVIAIDGATGSPNWSNFVMCQCAFLPIGSYDTPRFDLAFRLPKPSGSATNGGSCWRQQLN